MRPVRFLTYPPGTYTQQASSKRQKWRIGFEASCEVVSVATSPPRRECDAGAPELGQELPRYQSETLTPTLSRIAHT
jgi:hypothetical protein